MTDTTPIERLQEHSLTDETARQVANYTKPNTRDYHDRAVVPVVDTGDEIEVRSPSYVEGGQRIRWSDNVIMTFSAGGKSVTAVKRAYREAKARRVAQSKRSYR